MQLVIRPDGLVHSLYGEEIDLTLLGSLAVRRGSVERGERNISLQNIVALARALKSTPSSLLDGVK